MVGDYSVGLSTTRTIQRKDYFTFTILRGLTIVGITLT